MICKGVKSSFFKFLQKNRISAKAVLSRWTSRLLFSYNETYFFSFIPSLQKWRIPISKPNILWIMTDQFRADALSCAGGPGATPNLDALAREGVRFSNCSTVAPLCVPARILIAKPRPSDDPTLQSTAAK